MRDQIGRKRDGRRGGIAREEKQACTYKRKIRMCGRSEWKKKILRERWYS